MIKQVLLILLGIFFLINGINHFFNSKIIEEYAEKRSLLASKLMVKLSGIFLCLGGLSLISGYFLLFGLGALCLFLVIASFTIHKFWAIKDREIMMLESMHFAKNWAIIFELLYIGDSMIEI
ncbi:DoxX family membrane protein [Christiangramia sediminis]|uniref:DoxX family protein n=1 Tax=Christiangramia sediminis TaxID=2881336 RepID=A0A9X1LG87_9FLAO|nr:DoxX family membrane protein [Christiangramia sediminis]MCB7479792.1 hypothetical protein [Christiangramia sediminis]